MAQIHRLVNATQTRLLYQITIFKNSYDSTAFHFDNENSLKHIVEGFFLPYA